MNAPMRRRRRNTSRSRSVARVHSLVNAIEKASPSASRDTAITTLVRLIAPMLPHLSEEAWAAMGNEGLVADAPWPNVDPAMLIDDEATIAVQINGKLRDTITVAKGMPKDALEALAMSSANVVRILDGATPKKVVVVADRLVNVVV